MSTRIHRGRRLDGGIARVHDLLLRARPEAQRLGRSLQTAWMTRRAVEMIDVAAMEGRPTTGALGAAWSEMLDRQAEIRRSGRRDPAVDVALQLWLFPRGRRDTLAIVDTERPELLEWLDALPFVHDHSYWNNTDPPDDVASNAWERRGRDWDEMLPGAGVPAERCLTMDLFSSGFVSPPAADEAVSHVPALTARIERQVERMHLDAHRWRLHGERKALDPEREPHGLELYHEARRAAGNDDEGRKVIEAKVAATLRPLDAAALEGRQASD